MNHRRNGPILWLGCFLTASSFSLVMPFLPIFIRELGVTSHLEIWAGATFAVTFLSSTIMSPIWGNMADRYGRKIMIIRSGAAIALVYVLMSWTQNHYQLFVLRFLNGMFAGFIPSSIALMATNTPEDQVGRSLAALATATATGQILGPLLGGALADAIGIRPTMQVAAGMMAAATLLVALGVKETIRGKDQPRTTVREDLRMAAANPTLMTVLIATIIVNVSVNSVEPILTLHISHLKQEAWLAAAVRVLFGRSDAVNLVSGAIFSLPAVAMVMVARAWARQGEKVGFPSVLQSGLWLAGLFVLPQALARTALQLAALRLAYGLCQAAVQPSVNATIATAVPREFRGRAYGISTSAMYIGAVSGPLFGGLIATYLGSNWVFVSTGLLLIASSFWVRSRLSGTGQISG